MFSKVANIVVNYIAANMVDERIWAFHVMFCNIDHCRQTSFKEHIVNASQTLESYEMQNWVWILIFLSLFNHNYIPLPQGSIPYLLTGILGLIIIHNCLCENKMYSGSQLHLLQRRWARAPSLNTCQLYNNEETENRAGGEWCFWFSENVLPYSGQSVVPGQCLSY